MPSAYGQVRSRPLQLAWFWQVLMAMSFGLTFGGLAGLVRVALAAIALIGVPMADALICADEAPDHAAVHAVAANDVSTPASDNDREPVDVHQCMHGHCHHAGTYPSFASQDVLVHDVGSDVFPRELAFSLQSVATGLERPPKA